MQEIINIPLKNLTLLEKNPRKISKDQMSKLENSLVQDSSFLWRRPVLVNQVDDKLIVYAGNQRVRAAKKLKWKQIPCIIDKDLSEDVINRRVLQDNKTFGSFDYDMLANEYEIDMLLDVGFTLEELQIDLEDAPLVGQDLEKKSCELCGHKLKK